MSQDSLSALAKALLSPSKEDVWARAHYSALDNELSCFRKDDYGDGRRREH